MTREALELRKKRKKEIARKTKIAEIWARSGSLEQFLLEVDVKAPEANKLDLLAVRSLHLKKSCWKLWNACYLAAMICSVVWLLLFLASLVGGEQFLSVFGSKLMCCVYMSVLAAFPALFFFFDSLAGKWESFLAEHFALASAGA